MGQPVIRYSEAFKRQVVEEYEAEGGGNLQELRRKYDIRGAGTIQRWVRKYGRQHLLPKVVRVETMEERDELRRLRQEVRELKEALCRSRVELLVAESYVELACEEMGRPVEEFKKNAASRRWSGATDGAGRRLG